jgi:hypothetical protein
MAENAFPISQWTDWGASNETPVVNSTSRGFSGSFARTAMIAEVSMTRSIERCQV